jgi:mono/diheme cytochrome c family protein
MAEKKSVGHAYNVDFLNVVFAASSLFLFLSVVWMVWDDFNRDWKNTQRQYAQLQYQITQAQLQQANRAVDQNKLKQLESQEKAAQQSIAANQQKVDELQKKLDEASLRLDVANRKALTAKANYDHDRYDFEASRVAGAPNAAAKGKVAADEEKGLRDLNLQVEQITAEVAGIQKQLGQYTGTAGKVAKQIDEMHSEQNRLRKQLDVMAPSLVKDYFRNAPLLDFMAPTIKVQQMILPTVYDDVNFIRVPKMDRCTTCHLAIDKKDAPNCGAQGQPACYSKYPQPFRNHPNLSTYLGGDSPHPIDKIGCTVCHEGMGQSISFRDAAHAPASEKQQEEWEKKYHWEQPHLWDYPMLPTKMTEASCAKCHRQQVYVPAAPNLNVAYATFERAGCYACHKTKGFDTNMKKPGPSLLHIKGKLKPQWVANWIREPRASKPATWMPQFWYNSNNSSPEDAVRNEAEINAVTAYLFENSEDFTPRPAPKAGDFVNGEKIVQSVGCLGCHVTTESNRSAVPVRRTFGPPLQGVGSKAFYSWIYDWVKDPQHYHPGSYMPNLRLTDQEAADVAAYLVTLGGMGSGAPVENYDRKATDAVLLDYLKNVMPFEDAKAQIGKWTPKQRQIELGQRAINRYGCFSCHDIKGFENAQSIGTDLSEEGSKLVTRLDFAFISDIPHTSKLAWFRRKLHDPRVFDQGRVLQPLDKLRMPNFHLSDEEVDHLVTAVMSLQREIQPLAAYPTKTARYDYLQSGRTLVHRRNCVGCHIIEDDGGDFLKLVADSSLGPPRLTPEGVRVQPDWLYAFVRSPITIRPWLKVRMPTFGLDDPSVNGAIHYFQAISNTLEPFRTYDVVKASNNDAVGKALFEELKCQKCHVLGAIPKDQPTENLAPDLRMVPDRLNPDWIIPWLKDPASFLPGTRMTAFWPKEMMPKSPYPELGGDAEAQMRAVRDHLLTFKGGPSPRKGAPPATVVAAN